MQNEEKLILTHADFEMLSEIVNSTRSDATALLEEELGRASIVSAHELPQDVVSMNSTLSFVDLDSGIESVMTLVYPNEANIEENKISILAPVGSALIGLKVGQEINWPVPSGKEKRIKVLSVISQPETPKE